MKFPLKYEELNSKKMANNDFILKVLERFYQNFNFFDKNRDNEKVFQFFFPNFKYKVCSQDFSSTELGVNFSSDLVIFK